MKKPTDRYHRKFPRFTPCRGMYVFHGEVGWVLDIGMGGVSFAYITENHQSEEFPAEGILFTQGGGHIPGIPFETIGDHVHGPFFSSGYCVRERRIRFGELDVDLVRRLECFILAYANIPQLSYDSRYLAHKSVYADGGSAVSVVSRRRGESRAIGVSRQPETLDAGEKDLDMDNPCLLRLRVAE